MLFSFGLNYHYNFVYISNQHPDEKGIKTPTGRARLPRLTIKREEELVG